MPQLGPLCCPHPQAGPDLETTPWGPDTPPRPAAGLPGSRPPPSRPPPSRPGTGRGSRQSAGSDGRAGAGVQQALTLKCRPSSGALRSFVAPRARPPRPRERRHGAPTLTLPPRRFRIWPRWRPADPGARPDSGPGADVKARPPPHLALASLRPVFLSFLNYFQSCS